ncbi:MAG: peptide chain release factor 2 [Kiritimatiellae bacterium]|nr:peptide chain release factor 2 [Kiritimatiellia bacterium]
MMEEARERLDRMRRHLAEMRGYFDVDNRRKGLATLEQEMASPSFWDDQNKAKHTIEKANQHRVILNPFGKLEKAAEDVALFLELAEGEEDPSQKEQVVADAVTELDRAEEAFGKLELQSLLGDPLDAHNVYLSLHAGAGGTESCDWAEMLLRMYRRYCEAHEFEVTLLDLQAGEEAGIKSATLLAAGPFAYGYLKAERGVHRLVRISPFDANKRRHTSFASVDTLAEVDESIEIEIDENDLRVDTYRSSGAGGQHVNTTDSAVRITHVPTGIIVACQAERSQHKNRSRAMSLLRARLHEWTLDQKRKDMEKHYGEKGEIAWGHQIRSYVLHPYSLVKDLRTDTEVGNVSGVLDGDLDPFIEAFLKWQRSRQ